MIQDYLIKNQNINENIRLTKFLVDEYLSRSELEKSCEIFSNIREVINNNYLSKFNIYCLINTERSEEAQLQFDIKKELGFDDNFFEKKFNYLMGYNEEVDQEISEKSILDFHLSHKTKIYPVLSVTTNPSTPLTVAYKFSSPTGSQMFDLLSFSANAGNALPFANLLRYSLASLTRF